MKSRLSYFLISGIILLLVLTGIFVWHNNNLKEIPQPNEKSYTTPISTKYIPKNADIIFHWKINPTILTNYLGNVQDAKNKKVTDKKARLIRDSSFKLISINFERDISKWVGGYGSFALFNTKNHALNDWLMVLEINNKLRDEEVLESILREENIDRRNDSFNESNISKSNLISKRINSNKSIYFSRDKNHILISSSPKIIKSSIENLENNKLSTKEKYKNIQLKDNLNDGILLLEMAPNKFFNLKSQEKNLFQLNKVDKLISSMSIDKNKLNIECILSYNIKNEKIGNGLRYDLVNQEKQLNSFEDYILIDNPKQYFGTNSILPYQQLIASVIQQSITTDSSNLFEIILKNTTGNLMWLKDKDWLASTQKIYTNKKEINNILKKEKFLPSFIDFKNKKLEIWSKITPVNNEKIELKENIGGIIQENEDGYIWSQNLSSISNFDNKKFLANTINSNDSEDENNDFDDIIRIHLGKKKTEVFLNSFYPYILLKTMLGNKLDFPQNIDMSIASPTINYPDFVKFKIHT